MRAVIPERARALLMRHRVARLATADRAGVPHGSEQPLSRTVRQHDDRRIGRRPSQVRKYLESAPTRHDQVECDEVGHRRRGDLDRRAGVGSLEDIGDTRLGEEPANDESLVDVVIDDQNTKRLRV